MYISKKRAFLLCIGVLLLAAWINTQVPSYYTPSPVYQVAAHFLFYPIGLGLVLYVTAALLYEALDLPAVSSKVSLICAVPAVGILLLYIARLLTATIGNLSFPLIASLSLWYEMYIYRFHGIALIFMEAILLYLALEGRCDR